MRLPTPAEKLTDRAANLERPRRGINTAKKGRNNEHRTMRLLEAAGFTCIRAAGSHGPFDVVGFDGVSIVLVQVKTNGWGSAAERETLGNIPIPPNGKRLIHRWDNRAKMPRVLEV